MKYEVIPLIKEYMKDGLLSSKENDEKYFNAWMKCEALNEGREDPETKTDNET